MKEYGEVSTELHTILTSVLDGLIQQLPHHWQKEPLVQEGMEGPTANLDAVEKQKSLICTENQSLIPCLFSSQHIVHCTIRAIMVSQR
jgi:hypothetical protein